VVRASGKAEFVHRRSVGAGPLEAWGARAARAALILGALTLGCQPASAPRLGDPVERPTATASGPYGSEIASDEPFAHYRMHGGGETALATTDADGSRSFDGAPLNLGALQGFHGDEVTLEAWVRLRTSDADLLSYVHGDQRLVELAVKDGKLVGAATGARIETDLHVSAGVWHHEALSRAADAVV
jgi:hypothetical protein